MLTSKHLGTIFLVLFSVSAYGSSTIESASTCLVDSTTGRDRKDLVRWLFLAMAKHPEISNLAQSSAEEDEKSMQRVGVLFTRLIADDCPDEISAMVSENGISSLSVAFETLGKVAMQELMNHPNVGAVFSSLDQYTDPERMAPVLSTQIPEKADAQD